MSARVPLSHEVHRHVMAHLDGSVVSVAAAERLTLLIVGILASHSAVLYRMARALAQLALSVAVAESSERRLRRTLDDPALDPATCYRPVVAQVVEGPGRHGADQEVVLIIDESSKTDEVHLLRCSLGYWGGALPLAWAVWEQNVAMAEGQYRQAIERVLAEVATVIPPGVRVVVLADRAYAVPAFLDRLDAYGWSWVVPVTTTGSHRCRDLLGKEYELKAVVAARLARPGQRCRLRGGAVQGGGVADGQPPWRAGPRPHGTIGGADQPGAALGGDAALRTPLLDGSGVSRGQIQGVAMGGQSGSGRGAPPGPAPGAGLGDADLPLSWGGRGRCPLAPPRDHAPAPPPGASAPRAAAPRARKHLHLGAGRHQGLALPNHHAAVALVVAGHCDPQLA